MPPHAWTGTNRSIQLRLDGINARLCTGLIAAAGATIRAADANAANHDIVAYDRESARQRQQFGVDRLRDDVHLGGVLGQLRRADAQ